MFRSLFQDHLQGSSFALSAPTTLQLHASSFVCVGMWSYALYLYVYPVYLPVCCLVVLCTEVAVGSSFRFCPGIFLTWLCRTTNTSAKLVGIQADI
jgi:hypothetical protein